MAWRACVCAVIRISAATAAPTNNNDGGLPAKLHHRRLNVCQPSDRNRSHAPSPVARCRCRGQRDHQHKHISVGANRRGSHGLSARSGWFRCVGPRRARTLISDTLICGRVKRRRRRRCVVCAWVFLQIFPNNARGGTGVSNRCIVQLLGEAVDFRRKNKRTATPPVHEI